MTLHQDCRMISRTLKQEIIDQNYVTPQYNTNYGQDNASAHIGSKDEMRSLCVKSEEGVVPQPTQHTYRGVGLYIFST